MRLAQMFMACQPRYLALVALLLAPAPAAAQGPSVWAYNTCTATVTITTTTENVACSSPVVQTPRGEANVVVACYMQITTGTMTTHVIPRIRRGTAITGTLISEENNVSIGAAAGGTEDSAVMASEDRAATNVQYSCTMDQVAADGDGSVIYSAILVLAR